MIDAGHGELVIAGGAVKLESVEQMLLKQTENE